MLLGLDQFTAVNLASRRFTRDDVALGLVEHFNWDTERHISAAYSKFCLKFEWF